MFSEEDAKYLKGKTTHERFEKRQVIFEEKNLPKWLHHAWWIIHNAVAHPLIAIAPMKKTFAFHDYTSRKLMGK